MKSIIGLIMLVGVTMSLYCHGISGYCYRTDTWQVMIGGWAPWGFPPELPFGWNPFSGEYTGQVPDGWSGTITPHCNMSGTFEPASITYTNVTESIYGQVYAFTPTPVIYTISGRITDTANGEGLAGVTLYGLEGNPVTDEDGCYNVSVPSGYSCRITPVILPLGIFTPSNRVLLNIEAYYFNQNFTYTLLTYVISGRITRGSDGQGVGNVEMNGFSEHIVTDSEGNYSAVVPYGFSGEITPNSTLPGYFTPETRIYDAVHADQLNQ